MQERKEIRQLFQRYREGRCTPEEQARLHAWFNRYAAGEARGLGELQGLYETEQTAKHRRWLQWIPYAAAILILGLASVWFFNDNSAVNRLSRAYRQAGKIVNLRSDDIAPGGNRATLTLADGQTINLSEFQEGIIISDEVTYSDGSTVWSDQVTQRTSDGEQPSPDHRITGSLVLTTPKGGTYQITLPDGTRVWLNAASTLKYPPRFDGGERVVEIEGEGYFSIAKDKNKPFKVISRGQEIDVLGTEFNISAYAEDPDVKTTLVEGAVQLRAGGTSSLRLDVPGEEGVFADGRMSKKRVDPSSATAWKDGDFYFDNTPLADMMKQIARWYDVEVVYEGAVPSELFSGGMSRNVTLQTVLELLRVSEVNYRIEDNRLIIE